MSLKVWVSVYWAWASSPLWMASMMALVCFSEMRWVKREYLADAEATVDPAGVQQPDTRAVLLDLPLKHLGVQSRVSGQEYLAETG